MRPRSIVSRPDPATMDRRAPRPAKVVVGRRPRTRGDDVRNTEKRLPLCAAIAALVLSGVLVLTPAGAFADSSAPSPSPTSPPPADPEPPTPSPSPTPDATSSPAAEDSALSTPSPAPKDSAPSTPTPTMSAAPEEQASRLLVADAVAVTTFTNVTELADAFASASGNAWIVLSQTLTGTTSDPAVSLHPGERHVRPGRAFSDPDSE